MALRLELSVTTKIPIDLSPVLPSQLAKLSASDIEHLPIWHGNRQTPLAELFKVSGDASDQRVELAGDLSGVHRIGAKLDGGVIHVEGNTGRELGSEMTAGEINVAGNAGDFAGQAMRGGLIRVHGDAGDFAASSFPAATRGMAGGTLLVDGNAGREVSARMRRGLVAIGGDVGTFVGFEMLAGSIFVFGNCGVTPGAGMRRGTIGLFGSTPPDLLPTFRHACRFRPAVLGVVATRLDSLRFAASSNFADLMTADCELFNGDLLAGGRGELLIRTN